MTDEEYEAEFNRRAVERWKRWGEAYERAREEECAIFRETVERVKAMTPEQFRQSCVDAGIDNPDGTLNEHYRDPEETV